MTLTFTMIVVEVSRLLLGYVDLPASAYAWLVSGLAYAGSYVEGVAHQMTTMMKVRVWWFAVFVGM